MGIEHSIQKETQLKNIMTKEELLQLPIEDLAEKIIMLEKEVKEKVDSIMFWSKEKDKVQSNFDRYKEAVKSVVLFID